MKKVFMIALACALALTFATIELGAGVSRLEWKNARKKFEDDFRDSEKRAKAVLELGATCDDERAAELIVERALLHDDFDVHEAAVKALSDFRDPQALAEIASQLNDQKRDTNKIQVAEVVAKLPKNEEVARRLSYGLKERDPNIVLYTLEAARTQGSEENRKDVENLLDNDNPRVAYEAARTLAAITGKWPEGFREQQAPAFFPEKINAHTTLFVLDLSEQMRKEFYLPERASADSKEKKKEEKKTVSRLDYARERLKAALRGLPEDSYVNISTFGRGADVYSKRPVRVHKRNLEKLDKWIDRLRTEVGRNTLKGIEEGLDAAEGADTVFLVTCDLPWGVVKEDPDKVRREVRKLARKKFLNMNVISLFAEKVDKNLTDVEKKKRDLYMAEVEGFMKGLADDMGGFYMPVRQAEPPVSVTPDVSENKEDKTEKREDSAKTDDPEKKLEPKKLTSRVFRKVREDLIRAIKKKSPKALTLIREFGFYLNDDTAETIYENAIESENAEYVDAGVDALLGHKVEKGIVYLCNRMTLEKDWKRRVFVAEILGTVDSPKADEELADALDDDRSWQVRLRAAKSLAAKTSDKTLEALKKGLGDKNRRVAFGAAEAVHARTGSRPDGFDPVMANGSFPRKFFSSNVVFLMEASEEMGALMQRPDRKDALKKYLEDRESGKKKNPAPRPEPVKKIDFARERLIDAFSRLDDDTLFNVGAFAGKADFCWRASEEADPKTREKAAKFLKSFVLLEIRRDFYTPLEQLLRTGEVDTVYVVGAGLPFGAKFKDTEKMLKTLKRKNRWAQMTVHTVCLASVPGFEDFDEIRTLEYGKEVEQRAGFFKSLAEAGGGSSTVIDSFWEGELLKKSAPEEDKKEKPEGDQEN